MTSLIRTLAAFTIGLLAAAGGILAPAAVAPAQAASECAGVWVVVGGQGTRCATEYSTGKAALRSAGFTVRDKSPGFLCQINGSPATCTITNDEHWAYYQASRNADGTWGPWRYSQLGYTSTSPKKGDAEGWVFGAGIHGPKPPAPPAAPKPVPTQAPAPAPTTKPPAPAPTTNAAAPTKAATSKAWTPAKVAEPTEAPGSAPKQSAQTTAGTGVTTASAADPTSAEATSVDPITAGVTPESASTVATTPEATSVPTASPTVAPAESSPLGAVVTGSVLLAGGGALGGWWFLRRRGA